MNTIDCIKSRRSVRKFTEEKVPHEVLEQLVELARWAPSWKNTQIARYVAVEDEALKNRIAEEATIPWNEGIIKGAPVLMVMTYVEKRCGYERDGSFSTSKGDRWQNFDCGIAAATFELAAHELGLGSVVLGIFEEEAARAAGAAGGHGRSLPDAAGLSGGGARRPQAQGSGGAADHQVKISPLLPNGGGGFLFLAWREYGPRNGCEKGNFPLTSPVLPVIMIELFHRQQARIGV